MGLTLEIEGQLPVHKKREMKCSDYPNFLEECGGAVSKNTNIVV